MKSFFLIVLFIFLINCSFDDKTGIWKNKNVIGKKENNVFKEFGEIVLSGDTFSQKVELSKNFSFYLEDPLINRIG